MENSRMIRTGVNSAARLALDIAMFGEQQYEQNGVSLERFATCIIGCDNAPANAGVYRLFEAFVRTLATKNSVADEDGEAVEACRKICDLMGWPLREV